MATVPGEITYACDDGFFIIVDPDTYEVPDEDWDVDTVVANLEAHIAKGSAMAVFFDQQQLEPVYDEPMPLVESPTGDAVREFTFGMRVTAGRLGVLSYGAIPRATTDGELPTSGVDAPEIIELDNGEWTFTLRQLDEPEDEFPTYELVATPGWPENALTKVPGQSRG